MERWMIVYLLPLEVWMEIFCFPWITREEFGQLVSKIGNFKFAEHAQFYLHEWGKHKLGGLHFTKKKGFYKCGGYDKKNLRLEYPLTPMPERIKSIDYIRINCFDARTIYFLRRIRSLLMDVQIELYYHSSSGKFVEKENVHTVLTNLAQFLGVHSLGWIGEASLPIVRQCLSLKVLKLRSRDSGAMQQENVNILMDWLTQPGGPRLCRFSVYKNVPSFVQITTTVYQQFLDATTPSTFAMHIINCSLVQFAEFHLVNGIGEELHGVHKYGEFHITRHRANGGTELQEWIKANEPIYGRRARIEIYAPMIRSLDDKHMNVPRIDEDGHDDQQQPSTSKDT